MSLEPAFPTIDRSSNSDADAAALKYSQGRLLSLRNYRYSWWVHWRELADFFLPRRYRWIITPNMQSRGSPINQHILDSTGVICARNLASGLVSGKSSPTRPWFKLRVGKIDSTLTSPVSLWLAECERILYLIFAESNFYNSIAQFYYDLVIFGTATQLIFEDFENVINCINPCAGEYYIDIDGKYRPTIFYREFTMTIGAVVDEFGLASCSEPVRNAYNLPDGSGRAREIIVAHSIEPNDDGNAEKFGFSPKLAFRELFWEWGGSASPQSTNSLAPQHFLRRKGYHERPNITGRWDLVSNDPYGRSPGMDALPDQKQLQLESKRKAQAIDKMVNPPLVADVQLKNQPTSLLPGGMTYVQGYTTSGKPGIASIYDTKFPIQEITEDLNEVRQRLSKTFFNDVLMTASQYETRSNVTAIEWDMRKSESLVALGPALERIDHEVLGPVLDRVFGIASRAGILPPAPPEIQGQAINVEYVSMLQQAQQAAASAGIERVLQLAGGLLPAKEDIMDNIDSDYALDKYSELLNNDPKIIRSPEAVAQIRQQRAEQVAAAQQAEQVKAMAEAGKNLGSIELGGGNVASALAGGIAP